MTRGHFLESVRGNTEITLQDESVLGHQEIKFRGTKHITDNLAVLRVSFKQRTHMLVY